MRSFAISSRSYVLPWLEFEIPCPPSKNRKMGKLGNKTPAVVEWAKRADLAWVVRENRIVARRRAIVGKFEAEFIFGRNTKADFHNYEEFLFDWLQSREFIVNDKLCEWRASGWSDDVPKGRVKVRLRPWVMP